MALRVSTTSQGAEMRARRHATALIALLVAGAGAAWGCGGQKQAADVVDPVAQAAARTERSGTVQFTLHGTVTAAGRQAPVSGRGTMSARGDRGRMAIRFQAGGRSLQLEEILDRRVVYLGGAVLAARLPQGKRWVRIDLRRLADRQGIDLSQLDGGASSATRQLQYLRSAGDVKKVGAETIDGTRTTPYRANVDLDKLAANAGDPGLKRSVRSLRQATGTDTIPVDVWIDGSKRVRRERVRYQVAAAGQRGGVDFTIDFVRFGVPLSVQAPPRATVFDATDLAASLGQGG
jgi:hypothetical protein